MHGFRCLLATLPLFALPVVADEPPHPKLLVAIVVDQFSADLFNEYRPLYRHGLARLAGGVVFARGHQSHAGTETCPGHSTILTGARPARTGIIANEWQDPTLRRTENGRDSFLVYCVEKPGAAGSDASSKAISPQFLRVPTLGDRMKSVDADSRVAAVSGKDRSAVMLGGRKADITLWWTRNGFVTYTGMESSIPERVSGKLNQEVRSSFAQATNPKLPSECAARSRDVEINKEVKLSVGVLRPTKANSLRWRTTPALDSFTVDAALAAVDKLQLGKRNSVDLLAVSLSGTDYVGHSFGTEGAEMCSQQLALDRTIGRLLAALDKTKVPYVVALTADHGGLDVTERNRQRGVTNAEYLDADLLPKNVSVDLANTLGLTGDVVLGREFSNDIYFSASIPEGKHAALLDAAKRLYQSRRQVDVVFTRNELIAAAPPTGPADGWTLLERAKASFDPERSGELVVLLKPYVTMYERAAAPEAYVASHGSPWSYDRRVPILFWWQGVTGFEQPAAVETVDIAPTLASLIGLDIPSNEIDGRALTILAR